MSNAQRALWTFLFFTLVGPMLGALVAVVASPLLMWANAGPFMAGDHPPYNWSNVPSGGSLGPLLGQIGIRAYVWCAIPAALTALTLVPRIIRRGTVGWLEPAAGGAVCMAATAALLRVPHNGTLTYMCIAAAFVALVCWLILRRAGVLAKPEPFKPA